MRCGIHSRQKGAFMAKWKIYLFGAGKKGCYWLRCLKSFGTVPEGFIDNNEAMQGELCEGIPVYGVVLNIKLLLDITN